MIKSISSTNETLSSPIKLNFLDPGCNLTIKALSLLVNFYSLFLSFNLMASATTYRSSVFYFYGNALLILSTTNIYLCALSTLLADWTNHLLCPSLYSTLLNEKFHSWPLFKFRVFPWNVMQRSVIEMTFQGLYFKCCMAADMVLNSARLLFSSNVYFSVSSLSSFSNMSENWSSMKKILFFISPAFSYFAYMLSGSISSAMTSDWGSKMTRLFQSHFFDSGL